MKGDPGQITLFDCGATAKWNSVDTPAVPPSPKNRPDPPIMA